MRKLLLVLMALSLSAAPTQKRADWKHLREWDFDPAIIPTSTEIVFDSDVYVTEITITNTTGAAITVTISDRQGSPKQLVGPVSVSANNVWILRFTARWCPSGLTWVASSTGLVGYIRVLK